MDALSPMNRAIFQTARYTAARISEALALKWNNIYGASVVIPKAVTKKKVRTREIPLHPSLKAELQAWNAAWEAKFGRTPEPTDFLFPSARDTSKNLTRPAVDRPLREACKKLGFNGVSTHSFRRSALTSASDAGIPLRHIMELSGHSSLSVLQAYLQCSDQQKRACMMAFG